MKAALNLELHYMHMIWMNISKTLYSKLVTSNDFDHKSYYLQDTTF